MKKILCSIMMALMAMALTGCDMFKKSNTEQSTTKENVVTTTANEEDNTMKNLTQSFWKSEIMYDETVILVAETDKDGNVISMPKGDLLFRADEIIEVKQYFHCDNKGVEYFKEGEDFTIDGKTITIIGEVEADIEGINSSIKTRMPYITDKQLSGEDVFPGMGSNKTGIPSTTDGLEIPYTESYQVVQLQISVTYRHSEKWTLDTPVYQGDKLSNVISKLKKGENVDILIFGDSISTGSNSSSILKIYPNLDAWYDLMASGLEMAYDSKVTITNKSVGGWTSIQGVSPTATTGWVGGVQISQTGLPTLLNNELKNYSPDLAIIGFGMNDATLDVGLNNYANAIKKMIDSILSRNPYCDIILLGTMLANPTAKYQSKNQMEYSALNDKIAKLYEGNANVVTLNIGTMHQNLLDSGKKYMDMTGNNVNHPNDFMARIYCMNLLETLVKGE